MKKEKVIEKGKVPLAIIPIIEYDKVKAVLKIILMCDMRCIEWII